jgi:hypothetical protein
LREAIEDHHKTALLAILTAAVLLPLLPAGPAPRHLGPGDTYLNYRVYCRLTGVRTGQLRWRGGLGSTSWVTISA